MSEFVNTSETMGSEDAVLDALIAHSLATFNDDTILKLGQRAFCKNTGLTSVELPNVTEVGTYTFEDCTALTSAKFASLKTLGQYMFKGCTALTSPSFPALTATGQYAFQNCTGLQNATIPSGVTALENYLFSGCTGLKSVSIPSVTNIKQYAFQGCKSLNALDLSGVTTIGNYAFSESGVGQLVLPVCTSLGTYTGKGYRMSVIDITKTFTIAANKFNGANSLTHLILRSSSLCTLSATSALTGTPIAAGKGWVYVPTALIDTYKSATNWSTYAAQIVDIAEYPKTLPDETITDTWAEIFEAEDDGTYSTKYSVGDTKAVSIGGTSVIMKIVAMDADPLWAGSENAKITWISVQALESVNMNSTATTTGGWASCERRSWLREVIYPQIDSTVRARIKEVKKTYKDYTNGVQTIADTVWIPSSREIFGGTTYENDGPVYGDVFTDATSRIKKYGLSGSAAYWWLRSAYNASNFRFVNSNGTEYFNNAYNAHGLVLGFCT